MYFINEESWRSELCEEFSKPYFQELIKKILVEKRSNTVLPFPDTLTYMALELCPLTKVKVVMLGQDPYPNLKNAMGLAFGVKNTSDIPASLRNMFKELRQDVGIDNLTKGYGDLSFWAYQGILLLNTVLTVNEGKSGSHKGFGWEVFTDKILEVVCKSKRPVVYLLMGKDAQAKKDFIKKNSKSKYKIIETAHPSPFSAYKGFFWSKPFTQINEFLADNKLQSIDWRL